MHTGMLWFDNSQDSFEARLQRAVEYYRKKYGRTPDLCLAHPNTIGLPQDQRSAQMCGLTVRPYRPVLQGHIWIGIEDKG